MTSTIPTSDLGRRPSQSLEVHLLGRVDFDAALFLQERLVYELSGRDDRLGGLLLCEHPPLITVGREGSRAHILAEPRDLAARQMEVRWINRGGGCLVHAPGQLAVYPILPLQRLGLGLDDYRSRLEESLLAVCRELRVAAERRDDVPGVFGRCGQFAHLGVAVKSWISYHGLFVNVCPSLEFLRMIDNGRSHERISSLATERQGATSMHKVREAVVRHLADRLGYEKFHLYTGHPLLRRTRQRMYVPA